MESTGNHEQRMKMITKAHGGSFYRINKMSLESFSYLARGGRENH